MKGFLKKHAVILLSIVVFIFAFGLRCYYLTQKASFFADEMAGYNISTLNNMGYKIGYGYSSVYSGQDLMEMNFAKVNSYSQWFRNAKRLYIDNNGDNPHTNFYHTLYSLAVVDKGYYYEYKDLVKHLGVLNLTLFTMSFWLLYLVLRRLFKDNKMYIPLGLAVAFFNTGSISNTIFFRDYQLQETCFIFLLYAYVRFYQSIENNENYGLIKNSLILTIANTLAFLSGYFSVIYVGLITLSLMILAKKHKNKKSLLVVVSCAIAGFILTLLCYHGYFTVTESGRAAEAQALMLGEGLIRNTWYSAAKLLIIIFNYLFYVPVVLLGAFLLFKRSKQGSAMLNSILITSVLWLLAITYLMPFKVLRYVVPIFPALSIAIPYLASLLKDNYKKIAIAGFLFLYISSAVVASRNDYAVYGLSKFSLVKGNVENTYQSFEPLNKKIAERKIPVLMYVRHNHSYMYSQLFTNPARDVLFKFVKDNYTTRPHFKRFYFVCFDQSLPPAFEIIEQEGFKVIDTFKINDYTIFELED